MERSARDDEAALANGLDPCAPGPGQLTALMGLLHDSAEEAKRAKRATANCRSSLAGGQAKGCSARSHGVIRFGVSPSRAGRAA
jgi:hypothetical protein